VYRPAAEFSRHRLPRVVRPGHLPEGQEDAELGGFVALDERGVDRPVPVRPRADEVDERHVEQARAPESAVEVVFRVVALVAVEDAVGRLLVLVADPLRRARNRPCVVGFTTDPERAVIAASEPPCTDQDLTPVLRPDSQPRR